MYGDRNVTELEDVSSCASPAELFSKGFSRMNEFRKEDKYCDVNVVVDGTTFPCHRIVLSSASIFFDNMFGGRFKESEEKEIQLKNLSAECFKNVLEFFYTKELKIDSSNSYELLVASIYFGDRDMENCCVEYLVSHLPEEHIVETCIYAKSNHTRRLYENDVNCSHAKCGIRKRLYENTVRCIARNWSKLCKEDNLLEISVEILEDVVNCEALMQVHDDVVSFIPRWKEKQNADSSKVDTLLVKYECGVAPNLFVHLSTHLATADYTYIYNGRSSEWKREQIFDTKFFREVNVVANDHLFSFYWNGMEDWRSRDVEFQVRKSLYDVHKTLRKPPIYKTKSYSTYCMAAIRDTIYFHRGDRYFDDWEDDDELLTEAKNIEKSDYIAAYIYDLDKWFYVPKPQYELFRYSCITSVNNQLYLIGNSVTGWRGESRFYAQFYDHRSPNWLMLPEMADTVRERIACCSCDEKVYVLGCIQNEEYSLIVFDLKAGRWEVLQSPSQKRYNTCFVSYDDKLWAFPLRVCGFAECYNPVTNSWTGTKLWDGSNRGKMHEDGDELGKSYMYPAGANDAFVW